MTRRIPLSLVIPAHNRHAQTQRLLASVAASSVRFETVLVDDGSTVPMSTSLDLLEVDVVHVRNERARGPAAARNIGLTKAQHEIVAFTDNDCVITPTWAERIYTYASRLPARFAGVGGRTVPLRRDVIGRYYGYHKILDPWIENRSVLYVVTANSAFRRGCVEKVGGFDESLGTPGGEDPGLCFKLKRAGFDLAYDSEAIVLHDFRSSLVDFARTFFRYGAGCRHQYERYGSA